MATMMNPIEKNRNDQHHFVVVHPLDDVPEKRSTSNAWAPCP